MQLTERIKIGLFKRDSSAIAKCFKDYKKHFPGQHVNHFKNALHLRAVYNIYTSSSSTTENLHDIIHILIQNEALDLSTFHEAFLPGFIKGAKEDPLGRIPTKDFETLAKIYSNLGLELPTISISHLPILVIPSLKQRYDTLIKHKIYPFKARYESFNGTLMHLAIANEFPYAANYFIEVCLKYGRHQELLDQLYAADKNGNTALTLAVIFGFSSTVELILTAEQQALTALAIAQPNPKLVDIHGKHGSPLELGCALSRMECIKLLIGHGATYNTTGILDYTKNMHQNKGAQLTELMLKEYELDLRRSISASSNHIKHLALEFSQELQIPLFHSCQSMFLPKEFFENFTLPNATEITHGDYALSTLYAKNRHIFVLGILNIAKELSLDKLCGISGQEIGQAIHYWKQTFKTMSATSLLQNCLNKERQTQIEKLLKEGPAQLSTPKKKKKKKKSTKHAGLFTDISGSTEPEVKKEVELLPDSLSLP